MVPHHDDDEKAAACRNFILERLQHLRRSGTSRPLVVGLNGVQGIGKTTLVKALATQLDALDAHCLTVSLDDFYLTHAEQTALARRYPDNALLQYRGEPGTHDLPLIRATFDDLLHHRPTRLPRYDKAAHHGQGDRYPDAAWQPINQPAQPRIQVIILEGWCVGFRPLAHADLAARYAAPSRTLHKHALAHLALINENLADYAFLIDVLGVLIHVDAERLECAYAWRQQQEECLRESRGDAGAGMTADQVVSFVDAYFPGYELYTDGVRAGVFYNRPRCQLHIVVDCHRRVKEIKYI